VGDDDVAAAHQPAERLLRFVEPQGENQAALAAVQAQIRRALTVARRPEVSTLVAGVRLDRDDIGAESTHQRAGIRPRHHGGDIEHAQPSEGAFRKVGHKKLIHRRGTEDTEIAIWTRNSTVARDRKSAFLDGFSFWRASRVIRKAVPG